MDCVSCGGKDFSSWVKQGDYEILRCRGCGLGITSPFPSAERVAGFNKSSYGGEERAAVYFSRRAEFEKRYSADLDRIKRFKIGGALLDVGCNIGMFMKAAGAHGFSVTGVEMNAGCAAYGREKFGLDIRTGFLDQAAIPDGAFDVVTLFDVLEHIPAQRALLAGVSRVLKPGGLLVVQSPNLDSFMARLMKENWNWLTPPDHLYHFTPGALTRLLGGSGFRTAEVRTWEPAADFTGNIYSAFPSSGAAGRVFRKLLWLSSLVLVPLLQRFWWLAGRGGLVEVYAVKEAVR